MKIYCELCSKTQPVRIDNCRDAKTNEPYQDIVCAECDFVIASGTDITQPEQEPVAWGMQRKDGVIIDVICPEEHSREPGDYTIPLYTAQPKREWVGLTEEETKEISLNLPIKWTGHLQGASSIYDFARAIEAKLKEENT